VIPNGERLGSRLYSRRRSALCHVARIAAGSEAAGISPRLGRYLTVHAHWGAITGAVGRVEQMEEEPQ